MTDKQPEIKHWLNRAFYADKKVKALKMLLKQHRERAEGFAVCCECNDKGKSSGRKNSTEDALIRLADIEQKLQQQIAELSGITAEIADAVSKLYDNDLERIKSPAMLLLPLNIVRTKLSKWNSVPLILLRNCISHTKINLITQNMKEGLKIYEKTYQKKSCFKGTASDNA